MALRAGIWSIAFSCTLFDSAGTHASGHFSLSWDNVFGSSKCFWRHTLCTSILYFQNSYGEFPVICNSLLRSKMLISPAQLSPNSSPSFAVSGVHPCRRLLRFVPHSAHDAIVEQSILQTTTFWIFLSNVTHSFLYFGYSGI